MDLQFFAQEKTEEATPRRLEDARKKGQVAKSPELVSACTLLAAYGALQVAAPFMGGRITEFSRTLLSAPLDWTEAGVHRMLTDLLLTVTIAVAPLLLVTLAAGLAANYLQVGFLFSLTPVTPDFSRINPANGFVRLFSRRSLAELAKSLAKAGIIGYIAYAAIRDDLTSFPALIGVEYGQAVRFINDLTGRLLLRVGLIMLVLGTLDYLYQRWEYLRSLRMTKQEVKEEQKQTDGNPELRARIRQKQRELARKRMMADVKKADVVLTNPTHYAVALEYTQGKMEAPRILAKGQGFIALRIREIATEAEIPVVENPPVARALYRAGEVGQFIPADLYQAVAEVLAFVYKLKERGY